jgi:hypothetical protein
MSSKEEARREALIKAAQIARVRPGADFDEGAITADAAAAHLLEFMRLHGEFALGLLQAASYMLSGADREEHERLDAAAGMTDRAISLSPRNPDVLRRAFTIFQRLMPDTPIHPNDIIITDTNWETLPKRDLLE